MTQFVTHNTPATLRAIMALPEVEQDQAVQAQIIGPFAGMFAAMSRHAPGNAGGGESGRRTRLADGPAPRPQSRLQRGA